MCTVYHLTSKSVNILKIYFFSEWNFRNNFLKLVLEDPGLHDDYGI